VYLALALGQHLGFVTNGLTLWGATSFLFLALLVMAYLGNLQVEALHLGETVLVILMAIWLLILNRFDLGNMIIVFLLASIALTTKVSAFLRSLR